MSKMLNLKHLIGQLSTSKNLHLLVQKGPNNSTQLKALHLQSNRHNTISVQLLKNKVSLIDSAVYIQLFLLPSSLLTQVRCIPLTALLHKIFFSNEEEVQHVNTALVYRECLN